MNAKQKRQLIEAPTKTELTPYFNDAGDHAPAPSSFDRHDQPPIGIESRDTLEILASSAPIEDTDPTTHLRIQIGERQVNGKYEVRVSYMIDDVLGEPFRAINPDRQRAYRGAAKTTFQRMQDHDAQTFEINPFIWIKPPVDPPYQAASATNVAYFQTALARRIEQKYGSRKD